MINQPIVEASGTLCNESPYCQTVFLKTSARDLTSYFFVRIFTILFFLRRLHFSVTEIDFGAKEKVETGEGQNI